MLVAFGLGQCIAAMPVATPGSVQTGAPTLLLTLVPATLFALGTAILSTRTRRGVLGRGWPAAIALLYVLSTLVAVAALDCPVVGAYGMASILAQVHGWTPFNAWLLRLSQPLTFFAAAAVLRRTAASLGARATSRALALSMLLALAAGALHVAAIVREARSGSRDLTSEIIDDWIVVITSLLFLASATGVIAAGLVVRNQWLAACSAPRPAPPRLEPSQAAPRQ
jgi:hypothetical protein